MTLSADDIKALIADFNASDWEEIAISSGDVNIVISRSGSSQLLGRPPSSPEVGEPKVPLAAHSASPSPAAERDRKVRLVSAMRVAASRWRN